MSTNILMPALSPTMTTGKLAKWLKKEGDEVKSGDILAEIETDKATMEVEAVDEGFIAKILVPDGTDGVAVNEVIAILTASKGEAISAPKAAAPAPVAAAPAPKPAAPAPVITGAYKASPNSTMRKVIARRLTESKQNVPHFYLNSHIEIDALLKLRAELNARSPKEGPGSFKLSVNDLSSRAAPWRCAATPM